MKIALYFNSLPNVNYVGPDLLSVISLFILKHNESIDCSILASFVEFSMNLLAKHDSGYLLLKMQSQNASIIYLVYLQTHENNPDPYSQEIQNHINRLANQNPSNLDPYSIQFLQLIQSNQ